MALNKRAFLQQGNTIVISAAVSAPAGIQAVLSTNEFDRGGQVRVHNAGPSTAFIGNGKDAGTAQTNAALPPGPSMAMVAGAIEVWTVNPGFFWSASTSSGTATVYITPGEGL